MRVKQVFKYEIELLGGERSLTYRDDDHKSKKPHLVIIGWAAGEDFGPETYRFPTIEEARGFYKKIRDQWLKRRYKICDTVYS